MTAARIDARDVAAMLAARAEEIAESLLGTPSQRTRRELRWGSKGSLSFALTGDKRGLWHDHERGDGGDILDLIKRERRCTFPEALVWAQAWLGEAPAFASADRAERNVRPSVAHPGPSDTIDLARAVWRESVPARGTAAETYLRNRGLALPDWPDDPRVIRFHPACPRGDERHPAMIALMTDPATGAPCGVQRVFVLPDGSDRLRDRMGKAMLGNAGVVRLSPDDEVNGGIAIAEGVETALAVMQVFEWRPTWAAMSAGNISTFPVLPGVGAITVFADNDDKRGAGMKAARTCCLRWAEAGREALIYAPPAGHDWHDAACGRGA